MKLHPLTGPLQKLSDVQSLSFAARHILAWHTPTTRRTRLSFLANPDMREWLQRAHFRLWSTMAVSCYFRGLWRVIRRRERFCPDGFLVNIAAALLFACTEVGLRLTSLGRLASCMGISLGLDSSGPAPRGVPSYLSERERRLCRAVNRVTRRWPFGGGACLRQSLTVGLILRHHHPRLRLAVGRDGAGKVVGHAWIEVDGWSVTEPGDLLPLPDPATLRPSRDFGHRHQEW